jgi:hypothetical protein
MDDFNEIDDNIFDSEYDDTLTLTGVDDEEQQEELLGRIWRHPRSRKRFVRNMFNRHRRMPIVGRTSSRDDFQRRFKQLPKDTRRGLLKKQKQLVDTTLYVVKEISGSKIIKMFQDDDNKIVTLSNISGGKLEKGNFMTLKGIQLLYGVADKDQDYRTVNFGMLPDFIRNGEYEFTANGSILIPSRSLEVFDTTGMQIRKGYNELVNPKMLETQQPMEFEAEWAAHAPERAYLKIILHGTSVAKY